MAFTADQFLEFAESHRKAAADAYIPEAKRAELSKKADWFMFLAQRERRESGHGSIATAPNSQPKSRVEAARSIVPLLTALWLTGAVVYLVGTLLFTNAILSPNAPSENLPRGTTQSNNDQIPKSYSHQISMKMTASNGAHAISPEDAPYESASLTVPAVSMPKHETSPQASLDSQGEISEAQSLAPQQQLDRSTMLTVRATAVIRNGPSVAAKKIGTATAGAKLTVQSRKKDWVQFTDPASGSSGWIQATLLAPSNKDRALSLAESESKSPSKSARVKPAAKEPTPAAPPRRRAYADLPSDEEFLPAKRRRPDLFNGRRMRQGLMSPDFSPPR